jgi:hypothetical protein
MEVQTELLPRNQQVMNQLQAKNLSVKSEARKDAKSVMGGKADEKGFVAVFANEKLDPSFGSGGVVIFDDSVMQGRAPSASREITNVKFLDDGIEVTEKRTDKSRMHSIWKYMLGKDGKILRGMPASAVSHRLVKKPLGSIKEEGFNE